MARHIKYLALAHQGKVLGDYLHWDKDTAAVEKYEGMCFLIECRACLSQWDFR